MRDSPIEKAGSAASDTLAVEPLGVRASVAHEGAAGVPRESALAIDFDRPIRETLIRLALPVVAANLLIALVGYVDFYMIGALGRDAQAALAMSRTALWVIMGVFVGSSIGATAFVARGLGAGRTEDSKKYVAQALMMCLYISLPITLIGFAVGPRLFVWLGVKGASAGYGWDYMSIIFLGMSVVGMRFVTNGVFNALGQTRFPMYLNIIFNVFNFLGNLLLIPRLGVMGCAIATAGTSLIVMASAVFILVYHGWAGFSLRYFKGAQRAIRSMLALGSPAMAQIVARASAGLLLYRIINLVPNATVGMAALGLGLQGEAISFMPGIAVMIASSTLVGQALGAKKKEKAFETYIEARRLALIIMVILGALFFSFARQFMDFFSNDPAVIAEGIRYLRINAIAQPMMAITFTSVGCLRGAGDTKFPFLMTITALYAVRIPLAYFFAVTLGFGMVGIWVAMVASNLIETLLVTWRVYQRKWLDIKLKY